MRIQRGATNHGFSLNCNVDLTADDRIVATADNLFTMAKRLPEGAIWQVVAIGKENLRLTALALALGGNARAGLEDTLYLRRGELSKGSTPLIERAVRLASDLDMPLATVDETARQLGFAAS